MPTATALPVILSGGEARTKEDEDKEERKDADLRQLPENELREKKLRLEKWFKDGRGNNLPDGGSKLRAVLDSVCQELARRDSVSEGPHRHGGGPEAGVQNEKGCKRVDQSRRAKSYGMARDPSNGKLTKEDSMSSFGRDVKEELYVGNSANMDKKSSDDNSADMDKISSDENSANMDKISSDDNSASMEYNGHNQVCTPALTCSLKRKGDTLVGISMRLRSRKGDVVDLVDVDTSHPDSAEETSNRSQRRLYYPAREHPNSIEIYYDDINCLNPESLLTSPIMNFYARYLQVPPQSAVRSKSEYHIFSTYFFSKLEELKSQTTCFLKLRRWWKGIDIFQKAYLLLPVHKDLHWSLVIVCMPAKEDQTGPIILHLDSLKFHNSQLIFNVMSRFLKEEWSYLNENASLTEFPLRETVWRNLPRKIEKKKIAVPQQGNEYDCGVFTLYSMQRFIQEAPERLHKEHFSMFGQNWFRPEEASQFRHEIRRFILSCEEVEYKDDATEQSCVEGKPKADAMEQSCVGAEPNNVSIEQSCVEAEPTSDDATEQSSGEA